MHSGKKFRLETCHGSPLHRHLSPRMHCPVQLLGAQEDPLGVRGEEAKGVLSPVATRGRRRAIRSSAQPGERTGCGLSQARGLAAGWTSMRERRCLLSTPGVRLAAGHGVGGEESAALGLRFPSFSPQLLPSPLKATPQKTEK